MDHSTMTLANIIHKRLLSRDMLLTIFDAGVALGMGVPCERPANETTACLIETLRDRWIAEIDAGKNWRYVPEPRLAPDEIPGWLLAHAERQALEVAGVSTPEAPPDDAPGDDCPDHGPYGDGD